ncbi:hypothetical protein IQ266_20165 [filamentous cyanobacterium LEGE 11480]|uniref:LCCL domain-containing protein n=1 Tax=Romeriopsis navalis LEGE 11480 TaxID=2777977 RepID=A0A928Z5J5_9CYAN|nr:LCCL domain-containing protein [Romeriopsis navalis]MBE9032057.1 hypothetical protein [Romeriopsis navalis LEGE 11480]
MLKMTSRTNLLIPVLLLFSSHSTQALSTPINVGVYNAGSRYITIAKKGNQICYSGDSVPPGRYSIAVGETTGSLTQSGSSLTVDGWKEYGKTVALRLRGKTLVVTHNGKYAGEYDFYNSGQPGSQYTGVLGSCLNSKGPFFEPAPGYKITLPKVVSNKQSRQRSQTIPKGSEVTWKKNASDIRGRLDQDFTFICPPNGRISTVWGTDIYTDDSSICSAAVHAGLITARNGGAITIRMKSGEESYTGIKRNGVKSRGYGNWSSSFIFLNSMGLEPSVSKKTTASITWGKSASKFRGRLDQDFTFICPSNGRINTIWGTDIYTDDSSICSAAVHAGLITARNGGAVTIRMKSGEESYTGIKRNGVKSSRYGSWSSSFIFLK